MRYFISNFLIGAWCVLAIVPAFATIHHVPGEYPQIQSAILVSLPGDTVLVEPGIYLGPIDFGGRDILVGSRYIMNQDTTAITQTVVRGNPAVLASVVRFAAGESREARLAGFTITGGETQRGGGIICDDTSPTLDHLRIVGNTASVEGGGIYAVHGAPRVAYCEIAGNVAETYDGGGICAFDSGIVIEECIIRANHAWFRGAGIYCESSEQTIRNNTISDNVIDESPPEYCYGGGMASRNCAPIIEGNYIADNNGGGYGGGVFY